MTKNTSTETEAEQEAPVPAETETAETEQVTETTEQVEKAEDEHPSAEAARYRRRLREAEAERDVLLERIETFQRAEVERQAAHLTQPSAIWAAGVKVADVLDADGNLDSEKVATAITTAAETLGLAWRPQRPKPRPAQRQNAAPAPRGNDMADVIAGTNTSW